LRSRLRDCCRFPGRRQPDHCPRTA
jgi:hypothetical protein